MKNVVIILIFFVSGAVVSAENPLLGRWEIDIEKTLASTIPQSSAYKCFKSGLCGKNEYVFSGSTLKMVTLGANSEILSEYEEEYKIDSLDEKKIKLFFPEKNLYFIYYFNKTGIHYYSTEYNFVEYLVKTQ